MKKVTILILVITMLLLSNCNVYTEDIEKAQKFCEKHGGLMYINPEDPVTTMWIKCNDKSTIYIKDIGSVTQ